MAAVAADVALIIDRNGTIREVAGENPSLPLNQWAEWIGQSWSDVVSVESRPKVEAMQRDAQAGKTTRWRHLNHPGRDGIENVPVMYRVVPLGADGSMVAVGRDLQEMAELQRRLLEVQQSADREEKQRRQAESRQRMLFQSSVD
ncbi:MAG: transcriptional regulator PpsR, partial [Betaproteobacteria bacterium]|nr:transcriptional regulator PpsR [Betaproteobacteria bacterium]